MRQDFHLMKALADVMHVGPKVRMDKLTVFNNRLQSHPDVVNVFNDWEMKLDRNFVEVQGRQLPPETIVVRILCCQPLDNSFPFYNLRKRGGSFRFRDL